MRVLIVAGGRLAQNIAKRLLVRDEYRLMFRTAEHQITFIEEDESLCKELEHRYNVPIYQGDGTKKELLEQVGRESRFREIQSPICRQPLFVRSLDRFHHAAV